MGKLLNRIVWYTALIILFGTSSHLITKVVMATIPKPTLNSIAEDKVPSEFPVLVISYHPLEDIYTAKVVFYSHLNEYLYGLSSYSFLVPYGKNNTINKQLQLQRFVQRDGFAGQSEVVILEQEKDKQLLRVTGLWGSLSGPRYFTGVYEATPTEFKVKKFQHYYPFGLYLNSLPAGVILAALLCAFVAWIFSHYGQILNSRKDDDK